MRTGVVLPEPGGYAGSVKPVMAVQLCNFIAQFNRVHADATLGFALFPEHGTIDLFLGKRSDVFSRRRPRCIARRVLLHELGHDAVKSFLAENGIAESATLKAVHVHQQARQCCKGVSGGGMTMWKMLAMQIGEKVSEYPSVR
jgi:hypothetical protein